MRLTFVGLVTALFFAAVGCSSSGGGAKADGDATPGAAATSGSGGDPTATVDQIDAVCARTSYSETEATNGSLGWPVPRTTRYDINAATSYVDNCGERGKRLDVRYHIDGRSTGSIHFEQEPAPLVTEDAPADAARQHIGAYDVAVWQPSADIAMGQFDIGTDNAGQRIVGTVTAPDQRVLAAFITSLAP